jgi:hypothetical protein
LPRKRADDLADQPGGKQRGQAGVAIAVVVVVHREVAGAAAPHRVDECERQAGLAEAANERGGPVCDAADRGIRVVAEFDHAKQ